MPASHAHAAGWDDNAPRATKLLAGLRLPVIVAPMFLISRPELVIAAAKAGVIGAFPAPNARTLDELRGWRERIQASLARPGGAGGWLGDQYDRARKL